MNYYVFLVGDRVPEWIERVTPAGAADVYWSADVEVSRFPDHVEVQALFPPQSGGQLLRIERNVPEGVLVILCGAPTHWLSGSRHFPSQAMTFDFTLPEEGEEWKQ